jgi:hypothetical protein
VTHKLYRADLHHNHGIRGWNPPRRFVRNERTRPLGALANDLNTDELRKHHAYFIVEITPRRRQLRVLHHERPVHRVRWGLFHVCHSKVWTPCLFSFRKCSDPVAISRLHRIRKVGRLSDGNPKPTRRPWIPLPLRRRTPNNWLTPL